LPSVGPPRGLCPEASFGLVGAALVTKIAKAKIKAIEKVIWSAEARVELFCFVFHIIPLG
jgi:hypothetical protein